MTDTKQPYGSIDSVNLNNNKKDSKHGYRMILITIVVLLVAVGGILVSQRENLQQILKGNTDTIDNTGATQNAPATTGAQVQPVEVPSSSIQDRQVAWLEVSADGGNQLSVGETKTLYIRGNSGERDVTGYDMLIAYDTSMLEIQSVTSALTDYEIFKFDRGNHMTITGIKNFQKREPVTFSDSTILEIVVKAKKNGATVVSLNQTAGQEKTQLVDADVNVIEPQIGSIQLEIQ